MEDDRDLCNYLICNLQVLFEEVYEAHDGMEALPILTSRRPQIVLSDIKCLAWTASNYVAILNKSLI